MFLGSQVQGNTFDAFSISWTNYQPTFFFSLTGKILQKLEEQVREANLIIPKWDTNPGIQNYWKIKRKSKSASSNSRFKTPVSQQSTSSFKQKKNVSFHLSCVRSKLKSRGLSEKYIKYISKSLGLSTNKKNYFIWNKC